MSELVIDGNVIDTPIEEILLKLRSELSSDFLYDIERKEDDVVITCPFHKDGHESHPSCYVYCGVDKDIEYGYYRCFTCGSKGPLSSLVAYVLGKPDDRKFGEKWLVDRFGGSIIEKPIVMEPLDLESTGNVRHSSWDAKMLSKMDEFHPYMAKRKLSREVCRRFNIRYDPKTDCIVFPVNDVNGNMVMVTRRSVTGKNFYIEKNAEKPVYLLDYEEKNSIGYAIICESQINALTCHTYNLCGVAMFGTGSSTQYDILNSSGIRYYVICFDGDEAGRKGTERFLKNIRKDVFVDVVQMPPGKDVNDLSKEEFLSVLSRNAIDWKRLQERYESSLAENSCNPVRQGL